MALTPREYVLSILQEQTERDKQVKIGASNLSNGCTYCLAVQMSSTQAGEQGRYWLGAKIGTAIHEYLEQHAPAGPYLPETKVILGEIEGYGTVGSTSDLFMSETGTTVDFKTTTREKLKYIKRAIADEPNEYEVTKVVEARAKIAAYQRQLWLYGLGMENGGHTVTGCAIVFICRDGLNEDDIYEWPFPYVRERAEAAWDRGVRLWAWLQDGGDPGTLKSDPNCWACTVEGRA